MAATNTNTMIEKIRKSMTGIAGASIEILDDEILIGADSLDDFLQCSPKDVAGILIALKIIEKYTQKSDIFGLGA
jgi:hypothetical protein